MSDASKRDNELDKILNVFRKAAPSSGQLADWQKAVQAERTSKKVRWYQLRILTTPQLAAALVFAFGLGAIGFGHKSNLPNRVAEISEPSATIEQIYAKAE